MSSDTTTLAERIRKWNSAVPKYDVGVDWNKYAVIKKTIETQDPFSTEPYSTTQNRMDFKYPIGTQITLTDTERNTFRSRLSSEGIPISCLSVNNRMPNSGFIIYVNNDF